MRTFLIGFTATVVGLVVLSMAIPRGEVVTLHTLDANGRDRESVVWVVDLDSGVHLRSGDPGSTWLARLRANPAVGLERDGETLAFRARVLDDAATRRTVNEAMAEKYGLADLLVGTAVDFERSVPIRLVPSGAGDAAAAH